LNHLIFNHSHRLLRAAHGEKPNITGFDMRKFLKATATPRYDPWERKFVFLHLFPTSDLTDTNKQY
jgi:hypothetical protein